MSLVIKSALFITAPLALGVALLAGSPTPAPAADVYGNPAELQQCVTRLRASGRYYGGVSEEMGVTEYDAAVGHCMNQFYRLRGAR
jgi:hypothetical protein